jgi:hypothetical protein
MAEFQALQLPAYPLANIVVKYLAGRPNAKVFYADLQSLFPAANTLIRRSSVKRKPG